MKDAKLSAKFKTLTARVQAQPAGRDVIVPTAQPENVVLKAPKAERKGRKGRAYPVWLLEADETHLLELSKYLHNHHKKTSNSAILLTGLHRLACDKETIEAIKRFEQSR